MSLHFIAGLMLCLPLAAQAQNTKICSWLVETNKPDNVRRFDLWLQADGEVDFTYKIGGDGVVTGSSKSHSPSSGTYVLHAGKAENVWGFGTTLDPPAKVDISIELHQTPADVFSDAPTPLLAKFLFRREVPESEKNPPPTLAKKQCELLKKK